MFATFDNLEVTLSGYHPCTTPSFQSLFSASQLCVPHLLRIACEHIVLVRAAFGPHLLNRSCSFLSSCGDGAPWGLALPVLPAPQRERDRVEGTEGNTQPSVARLPSFPLRTVFLSLTPLIVLTSNFWKLLPAVLWDRNLEVTAHVAI